jgi:LPXTG-motif cell wall-anchored protein
VSRQRVDRRTRFSFWGGLSSVAFGLLLLVGVMFPTTAGATVQAATASTIPLHNNTAGPADGCPPDGGAYWHFVFAPNDDKTAFVMITLNLNGDVVEFSGAQIIPNGGQMDNVFVAVPSGHVLTDLETSGSFATYSGATPKEFNLSGVCEGSGTTTTSEGTTTTTGGTTTTTGGTTTTTGGTTTTTGGTTTTTGGTTTTTGGTTTTTGGTTTTTGGTTTTTGGTTTTTEGTTTTTGGTTTTTGGTTTTSEGTTTSTGGTTTTSEGTTTTTGGTSTSSVQGVSVTPSTTPAQVLGVSVTTTGSGTLPVTGSNATLLATIGAALVAGGLILVLASRRRVGLRS